MGQINTIGALKQAAAVVFADISASCRSCTYPDCQGYPWVVPAEEDELLAAGLQLVQLNGESGPIYLDTFPRDADGRLVVGAAGPTCPYRGPDGRCTVHAARPLTCHLYPLSLELVAGVPHWAVHRDCEFVQRAIRAGRFDALTDELRSIVDRIGPELGRQLALTQERTASVSRPTHMDCYTVIAAVTAPAR
jgi:Fe-S-cluster containining protein